MLVGCGQVVATSQTATPDGGAGKASDVDPETRGMAGFQGATSDTASADAAGSNGVGVDAATADAWTSTTGACDQTTVALGAAGDFAVLAASTVTNMGATTVTGNVGVSPGTSVTGIPPAAIVGSEHAGDQVAAAGAAAVGTAYDDAASRKLCPIMISGNLGGRTLGPGLYKSTSSLAISSGDLTLDAQGDPDAVFIFQMASTSPHRDRQPRSEGLRS